ncbi:MAG: hypothetical protein COB85_06535 [Bacteroidetes bacterium]|nr:MAG: hypothetical protein COB85_06535 [Bacteroidota bacterium]
MRKNLLTLIACALLGFNTSAQLNMTQLGSLDYPQNLSDIWGYVDTAGNEYALVGYANSFKIIDISDPAIPNELFNITGPSTTWRDIKVWGKHAFVTNEASDGMLIVDLSNLPNLTVPNMSTFLGSTYPFTSAHNLFIDENGVCYIFGADHAGGGAIMLDVATDPMNPIELGIYTDFYLHDGMVRGDTLWGAAINAGVLVAVDVSDKANPIELGTIATPNDFTHNVWISDDGNFAYTTDEKSNAFLAAYDVSDTANFFEVGRIRSNPGSGVIPHNTHFMNKYLITSYYRDGITIHDVTYPYNMIEVGNYDTHTASGNGFDGAWGVYPWLPSGNVIVSDIDNGLIVLGANYVRGCYLEGTVTDQLTIQPITNATISILTTTISDETDSLGDYATGVADSGSYQVVYSAPGYISDTFTLTLSPGILLIQDVQLTIKPSFTFGGQVIETNSGDPIQNAQVVIDNNDFTFNETTDASGNFSIPGFFDGTYSITVGKWYYVTNCSSQFVDSAMGNIVVMLDSGIYDDFALDLGWTVSGNAQGGVWERESLSGTEYNGEPANPEDDITGDCAGKAFVTGNGGSGCCDDDVDDGTTKITSPVFNLLNYTEPFIEYYQWFFNDGGFSPRNDSLTISISNGTQEVVVQTVYDTLLATNSSWKYNSFKVSDYITPALTMYLVVEASDLSGSGHIVEAGLDLFRVFDSIMVGVEEKTLNTSTLKAYPNPFGELLNIQYDLAGVTKGSVKIYDLTGRMLEYISLKESRGTVQLDVLTESGMYFVKLFRAGEPVNSLKVVKL